MKKLLFFVAAVLLAGTITAQPRVQMGVRAGIFSQDLELAAGDFVNPDIDTSAPNFEQGSNIDHYNTEGRMGFNLAVVSRVRLTEVGRGALGLGFFLQPEVIYSQNSYKMQYTSKIEGNGSVVKIRMQSVDIPVLLSAKVSIVRVQAGPVFNVMYKTEPVKGNISFIAERPSVGYSVGASVDIFGGMSIDGRYNGQFKDLRNNIKAGNKVYDSVKGSLSSWSVGLSWLL
jgi:hypothetical protein